MRISTLSVVAAIGLLALCVSACDEPAYDGPRAQQQQAPAAETQSSGSRGSILGGSSPAHAGAMRAAQNTAGRVNQHQNAVDDEIPD